MAIEIGSASSGNVNVYTSAYAYLTVTPSTSVARLMGVYVEVGDSGAGSNLINTTGGDWEFYVTVGGRKYAGATQTVTVEAGLTKFSIETEPIKVPANTQVICYIKSPNSADTNVWVYALPFYEETSDIYAISNDTTAASNLELALENGTAGYIASDVIYMASASFNMNSGNFQSDVKLLDGQTVQTDGNGYIYSFAFDGNGYTLLSENNVTVVGGNVYSVDSSGNQLLTTSNVNVAAGVVESNPVAINGTAQRAADLAEIAQYLFANAATLTSVLDDGSVMGQVMASALVSNYDRTTDSLEAIGAGGGGGGLTAQQTRDAMKLAPSAGAPAAGSIDDYLGVSGVLLAPDAITASVFDETTAWPLTQADTGASSVLREGADGSTHTGASLSSEIGNISSGSAAISTPASGALITTGSETNTYTDTHALDFVYHIVEDAATVTEFYYEFDVGATGVPVSILWNGYAQSNGDTYTIKAYNWGTTSWQGIDSVNGLNGTTRREETWNLLSAHVGSGANLGLVRVQITSADGTAFATDRILCNYAVVGSVTGYQGGGIWVDTINGTAGAVADYNGTADNPVDNLADAITLGGLKNMTRFFVNQGSQLAFASTIDGYSFIGRDYEVALGTQQLSAVRLEGAVISGTCTRGTGSILLEDCQLLTVSMPAVAAIHCAIAGNFTMTEAGTYVFEDCFSVIAGQSAPIYDFGAAVGNTAVSFRHASGGHEFHNMGASGTDTVSLEGVGQFILDSSCAGGSLSVRGAFQKTDNSGGAVTITDIANYEKAVIQSGFAQGSGTGTNQIQLSANASAVDGAYDPCIVFLSRGTGAGQSRDGLGYDGATKTLTVDRDWKVTPDTTTEYLILPGTGREHVNEGLAQGGASTTITLNTLASSDNDAYKDQIVFIRSGTGADQARHVSAYNGTSKVATVHRAWDVTPDSTSGYVMLPTGLINGEHAQEVWEYAGTRSLTDKDGFALAADGLDLVTAWTTDITGTVSGNAPAATALSNATWTDVKAGYLDAAVTSRLAPTVAGRTLDVTAQGTAGIDWANVENPTSIANLENTTVGTVTTVNDKDGYALSATGLDLYTNWAVNILGTCTGNSTHSELDVWNAPTRALTDKAGFTISGTIQTLDAAVDKALAYSQLLARKDAAIATDRSIELAEINADQGTGAGAYDNAAESQEALRDRGDAGWTGTTPAAVWAHGTRSLTDKAGFSLASTGLDLVTAWTTDITGTVSGNSQHSAADVWTSVTRTLTDKTGFSLADGSIANATFAAAAISASVFADNAINNDVLASDAISQGTMATNTIGASELDVSAINEIVAGVFAKTLDGKTFEQVSQYMAAVLAGEVSGAGTGTEVFKGLDGSTTRVTVTADSNGNRTNVSYNG